MDFRNVIFAIALSFAVLFGWSVIFETPKIEEQAKLEQSENAKKRINILKETNDGFIISEEDMKIRGFGDILGFKQSGVKNFKLADPIQNSDLFELAEKEIKRIELENENLSKFKPLIKLYDRADIINDIA